MKQTKSLKQSGSFINFLMSNNQSVPVVGEWATICFYSDRTVCKVTEVSKDGKKVTIQHYTTIGDGQDLCVGHQEWKHTPSDRFETLVYRNGAWRTVCQGTEFIDSWYQEFQNSGKRLNDYAEDLGIELWEDGTGKLNLIDGVSKVKTTYSKISIMFGVCDFHYDWTF